MQRHHATVSTVHALTNNPEQITREADIVVTAAGVPNLVRGTWLKPGAVVIDVGTYPIEVSVDSCYSLGVNIAHEVSNRLAASFLKEKLLKVLLSVS